MEEVGNWGVSWVPTLSESPLSSLLGVLLENLLVPRRHTLCSTPNQRIWLLMTSKRFIIDFRPGPLGAGLQRWCEAFLYCSIFLFSHVLCAFPAPPHNTHDLAILHHSLSRALKLNIEPYIR